MRLPVKLCFVGLLGAGCSAQPQSRAVLPELSLENVSSSQDGVSLTWCVFEATLRSAANNLISPKAIARFTLDRQDVASGNWTRVAAALPASARTYIDRDLDPGLNYRYRVTETAPDGEAASVESEVPMAGPAPWSFQFSNPKEPGDGARATVFVRIQKFERGVGRVEIAHLHSEGDFIGRWDHTFQHAVTLASGTSIEADFNTGAQLDAVIPMSLVLDVQRCKPFHDPDGTWIGCTRVLEKRTFQTHRITYWDRKGEHQLHYPDPGILNQLCNRHQENPNAVPNDRRLLEARGLLDEADRLWDSDSAASIALYQRLLKEYRDVVLRLQVRNRVEGRARQADDK